MEDDGDKKNFEHVYYNYRYSMLYVANQILNDTSLAEDAVQDAFIYIAKNFRKIRNTKSSMTKAYVLKITKHKAYDITRKRKKGCLDNYYGLESLKRVDTEAIDNIAVKEVVGIIQNLSETYSEILELNVLYGMKPKEIARLLNKKPNSVNKALNRGKQILQKELEKHGYGK